jgi:hypothetical protein
MHEYLAEEEQVHVVNQLGKVIFDLEGRL